MDAANLYDSLSPSTQSRSKIAPLEGQDTSISPPLKVPLAEAVHVSCVVQKLEASFFHPLAVPSKL